MIEEEVIADLRAVAAEFERAARSWTLFHESVRKFEDDQKDLVEAINSQEMGPAFNHFQMVMLHDSVSAICRIMDEDKPDRITVNSVIRHMRELFRDEEREKLKAIDQKRKAIVKSDELSNLRLFRNNQLGHTLRVETPPTKHLHIPNLIGQISDLLDSAYFLFGYPQGAVQPTDSKFEECSLKFWSCVEKGAQS